MQQRNLILFIVLSTGILMGWPFVAQKLGFMPKPAAKQNQPAKPDDLAKKGEKKPAAEMAAAKKEEGSKKDDSAAEAKKPDEASAAKKPVDKPAAAADKPREFPLQTVRLGSPDSGSPYFLDVELTSKGAAVSNIRLNDKRYKELHNPKEELKVVGNNSSTHRTFDLSVPSLDLELQKSVGTLTDVNWELVSTTEDKDIPGVITGATFKYSSPDGSLAILKHYSITKSTAAALDEARESEPAPYELKFKIEIRNNGKDARTVEYSLQGPVGLPLENVDNTAKFRDLKLGFLNDDGTLHTNAKRADALVKEEANQALEEWQTPFKYVGVDVQYFAAVLIPEEDQLKNQYIETVRPVLLDKPVRPAHTDISLQFQSKPLEVAPGKSVEHTYELFAGPKRQTLLEPLGASKVLDYGFAGAISSLLLLVLRFVHDLGLPYGLAIIGLTIMVRGCMFPLSRKQAAGAKRMKELQPKIAELKLKYGADREKFARAQMELFRENNYNPLSGCLPVVIQLPIFIGLYQALSNAVDLRMAPFLWIKNLAAPDALFRMPFRIPYLGEDFNLLPIITVALFVVQQKMFMPPPADEQQEIQFKMMNVMMIFMGAMFYHVPAGLCVYFIASSLWGMGERKLLDWTSSNVPSTPPAGDASAGKSESAKPSEPTRPGLVSALWGKLLESADAAGSQTTLRNDDDARANGKKKDKKTNPRR